MNDRSTLSFLRHPSEGSSFRIALVACYFGKLPDYVPLVFHSAAFNPSIDWLIVGDQVPACELPSNVRFHRCELRELEQRMALACKTEVSIRHVYDLASLKPAFGLTFEELLRGYDFWGHVDLDMIYGNLRKFLPDEVLSNHERIYARGHLSVFRNLPDTNRRFMLSAPGAPDYRDVFASRDHRPFDEWEGIWKIFRYHQIPQYHAEVIADIHAPTEWRMGRFEATEIPNYPHQFFYWHQGRVFQAYYHREGGLFDRELAYIHFQKRRFPAPTFQPNDVRGFSIGPDGFAPYDRENLTPEEMDHLNPDHPRPLGEVFARKFERLRRKLARIIAR